MATAIQNVVSHVQNNKHIYSHPYNWVTLALWAIALGSHAVLIPLFVREVLLNSKGRSSSLFG